MKNTIVSFHIGRGGRFHNAGHLTFTGTNKIGHYTENLFINFENWADVVKPFDKYSTELNEVTDLLNNEDFETLLSKFGILESDLGEKVYFDGSGSPVGLTVEEEETGIGTINIDHGYDTTYTKLIEDCTSNEFQAICNSNEWNKDKLIEEFLEVNEADTVEDYFDNY